MRKYLHGDEKPPPGVHVKIGPRGGRYYNTEEHRKFLPLVPDDIQSAVRFSELGWEGGIHEDRTHLIRLHPGVWDPEPGLHDVLGIFKPETEAQDPHAEVLAYQLDQILGFNVIPESRYTSVPEVGSISRWVDHMNSEESTAVVGANLGGRELSPRQREDFIKMILLDVVMGNSDRHGGNWIADFGADRVWGIDHGVAFRKLSRDDAETDMLLSLAGAGLDDVSDLQDAFSEHRRRILDSADELIETARSVGGERYSSAVRNNLRVLAMIRELPPAREIRETMQFIQILDREDL